jgi:small nuclear ribonucleoprotein (snRNP)-like protein
MKTKKTVSAAVAVIFCLVFTVNLFAEESKFELNESYGIKDVLNSYIGKRVSVRTDTGEALEGTVTKVGSHLVHITKLSGRDFYDAVMVIDKINSVVIRVRGN